MRVGFRRNRRRIAVNIDMTPMVDVMMLLVIFFMMSTAIVVVYPGFTVNLPHASAGRQQNEQVVVMIASDGRIAVDGQSVDLPELAARLKTTDSARTVVSIEADKEVRHGRVVEVMEAVQQAGVTKMAIAVEPTEP